MTTKDITSYIEEHKDDEDVQALIGSLQRDVKAYLETDEEGRKILASLTDKRITGALKTYAENHNAQTKETLKSELMQGYEGRLAAIETAKQEYDLKAEQEAIAFEFAIAAGYTKQQIQLCKSSIGKDKAETLENLELIKASLGDQEQKVKDVFLESEGTSPGGGELEGAEPGLYGRERLENMSPEEQSENWPKVLESMQQVE